MWTKKQESQKDAIWQIGKLQKLRGKENISAGESTWFVSIKERPGTLYNYSYLMQQQKKLKGECSNRGYVCPEDDSMNGIREGIAKLDNNLREKLTLMGCNVYLFRERDLNILLQHKKELPLFLGLSKGLDSFIGEALKNE